MHVETVYWWAPSPPRSPPSAPLEPASDVVVVGAGYTGLSAAATLARAGRSIQIFEKARAGEGASTRNGGITSGNLRPSHAEMARRFGRERAKAVFAEAKQAREDLYRFIADEGIECDFDLTGRFTGAATPGDYEHLAREADVLRREFGVEAYALGQGEQRRVLGTDFYYGGNVRMDVGGLYPAKLHAGLLRVATGAGASVHEQTPVFGIRTDGDGFEVSTAPGRVRARDVVVATNGYTDRSHRWLRRRLVPVRSRIIASAPLSPNLIGELMPRRMMCSETRKLHYYFRPSPDGTRILFGGRDGAAVGGPDRSVGRLRRAMAAVFPALDGVEITHSWSGNVAMNRDMIPRIFTRNGVRYAAGCCGSGVVWARWAGHKAALRVLGRGVESALEFRPPAPVPIYNGTPWFLPAVFAWMSLRDRVAAARRPPDVTSGAAGRRARPGLP